MRTTVRLDPDLLAEAKALAARTNRTLTKVIEDALRQTLARKPLPASNAAFDLPTFKGNGTLMPGVDLDSNSAMLGLMEEDDPSS